MIHCRSDNVAPIVAPGVTKDDVISVSADDSAETSRSSASGDRVRQPAWVDRLRDVPAWCKEFAEGLGDSDSKSSGLLQKHLFLSLCLPKEKGVNRNLFTHFPKDPNREICRRAKITRAPFRGNPDHQDGRLPHATTFGDVITADHKILTQEKESRLQHRYAK